MKTKLFAWVAAAVLGAPLAGVALADAGHTHGRGDRLERRYDDRYDSRVERGYDRRERWERREGREYRHFDRVHRDYVVTYHVHGDQVYRANGHDQAHRIVDELRHLGADAHIDGNRLVHFHMHGKGRKVFHSHAAAHDFERRLNNLGFHAEVRE